PAVLLATSHTQYRSPTPKLLRLRDSRILPASSLPVTLSFTTLSPSSVKTSTSRWSTAVSAPSATARLVAPSGATFRMTRSPAPPDISPGRSPASLQAADDKTTIQQITEYTIFFIARSVNHSDWQSE